MNKPKNIIDFINKIEFEIWINKNLLDMTIAINGIHDYIIREKNLIEEYEGG